MVDATANHKSMPILKKAKKANNLTVFLQIQTISARQLKRLLSHE